MSPFGARGGNSAIQDADNLGWKLALVVGKHAGPALLDTYDQERRAGAQQNIKITRRTSRFLSPATPAETLFRDAVIALAKRHAFARSLVNTGRMSSPSTYPETLLSCGEGSGQHLQNVALRCNGEAADLEQVMSATAPACLVIATGSAVAGLPVLMRALQGLPVAFAALDAPCKGALHLGDDAGRLAGQCLADGFTVVRADLYCAGKQPAAQAPALAERLKLWFQS
jgi:3-(3-hydroxy-phenyl)propionate hydroxylase